MTVVIRSKEDIGYNYLIILMTRLIFPCYNIVQATILSDLSFSFSETNSTPFGATIFTSVALDRSSSALLTGLLLVEFAFMSPKTKLLVSGYGTLIFSQGRLGAEPMSHWAVFAGK